MNAPRESVGDGLVIRLKGVISSLTTWTSLRRPGSSRILRSSWIWLLGVPVAAKILRQVSNPLQLDVFGQQHTISLDLPFSWYCLYFAAVAFCAATFLYARYCPTLIKEYGSFYEYYSAGKGARTLTAVIANAPGIETDAIRRELAKELNAIVMRSYPEGPPKYNAASSVNRDPITAVATEVPLMKREELGDLYELVSGLYESTHPKARYTVAMLYAIGFALSFTVAAQGFATVVGFLGRAHWLT